MMLLRAFLFPLTALLMLPGCGPIHERPSHYYTLATTVPSQKTVFMQPNQKMISIMPMVASSAYQTHRMAYSKNELELNYFAYQYWIAPPAELLTTDLFAYLQNHHFLVSRDDISRTYTLKTELLECKQDYTTQPAKAVIGIRMNIEYAKTHRSILTKTLYSSKPFQVQNAYHGVKAMNEAKLEVFHKMALVLKSMNGSKQARKEIQ